MASDTSQVQGWRSDLAGKAVHFQDRIGRLRTSTLELIDEMVRAGLAADSVLSATLAELQGASSRLAAAETAIATARRHGGRGAPAEEPLATDPPCSQDAAIVLALASTTLPSAFSALDEAERWLRTLRLHGRVGAALEALGVAPAALETMADGRAFNGHEEPPEGVPVRQVAERAAQFARARDANTLDTVDVLFAVVNLYGASFDRALYARATTLKTLFEALPQADRAPAEA